MGNTEVINQILNYVPTINFDKAVGDVSLFETTIRYLGGLLSGRGPRTEAGCHWRSCNVCAKGTQRTTCSAAR